MAPTANNNKEEDRETGERHKGGEDRMCKQFELEKRQGRLRDRQRTDREED